MRSLDASWVDAVCALCDPVFASADVGFVRQVHRDAPGRTVSALLWEADPLRFAARYPDSEVEDSYGEQWPPPCSDYWVYLEEGPRAIFSVEGWRRDPESLDLTGDGRIDGLAIGRAVAGLLRVAPPAG